MSPVVSIQPLDWPGAFTPLDVTRRWPADRPLVALHSGRLHERWSRWTILASPRGWLRVSDRESVVEGDIPAVPLSLDGPRSVVAAIDSVCARSGAHDSAPPPPFAGGWVVALSYDLGRRWEPAARATNGATEDRDWPLADLAWCPDALVYDAAACRWHGVGDVRELILDLNAAGASSPAEPMGFSCDELKSNMSAGGYASTVERALELIAAGDVFQVNLAQRLTSSFDGSTRRLWSALLRSSRAWYGAYIELPDGRCIASASPELFLEVGGDGRVVTRPIKGTRPLADGAETLRRSAKDAAELHMIVDLMRNDLGRVCEIGSIHVDRAREIETHPTVHHGVAQVAGRLRPDVSIGDLLRATFPAGSVTGAPKIRAMQIIDELEPVRRGLYCGSIGYVDRLGRAALNVAIRTATMRGLRVDGRFDQLLDGMLDYGAGAGIVAESDPALEADECAAKTRVLRAALREAAPTAHPALRSS